MEVYIQCILILQVYFNPDCQALWTHMFFYDSNLQIYTSYFVPLYQVELRPANETKSYLLLK